jgi:hypothetical protein
MGGSYFSKNSRWNGKKNIRILPKLNISMGISASLIIGKISALGWGRGRDGSRDLIRRKFIHSENFFPSE